MITGMQTASVSFETLLSFAVFSQWLSELAHDYCYHAVLLKFVLLDNLLVSFVRVFASLASEHCQRRSSFINRDVGFPKQ